MKMTRSSSQPTPLPFLLLLLPVWSNLEPAVRRWSSRLLLPLPGQTMPMPHSTMTRSCRARPAHPGRP